MRDRRAHQPTDPLHRRARRVRLFVRRKASRRRHGWRWTRGSFNCDGSVAAEFALVAPVILVITAGIVDFGLLTTKAAALAGAARIGGEYARLHPADTTAIQNAMQNSMSFTPPLTFPASFAQACECDDQTSIACTDSCLASGRPGPNRVFIRISANQASSPLVPWPGIPGTLTATTEIRLQ
jgi:Flp pilus assembly protein TadG